MPSPIDFKARGFQNQPLELNKGLDVSGVLSKRQPGTLRRTMNVELVDNILQNVTLPISIGKGALNVPERGIWVLEGNVTSDWTIGGVDLTNGASGVEVKWYKGSQGGTGSGYESDYSEFPAGRGFIWKSTSNIPNSDNIYFISHSRGLSPEHFDYFVWDGGTLTLTDTFNRQFMELGVPDKYGSNGDWYWRSLGAAREVHRLMNTAVGGAVSGNDSTNYTRPLGTGPVSHVFQTGDDAYAVRDYLKVRFNTGTVYIEPDTAIYLDDTAADPDAVVAWQEITAGSIEGGDAEGWLYLYQGDDGKAASQTLRTRWLNSTYPIRLVSDDSQVATSVQEVTAHGVLWTTDIKDGGVGKGWSRMDTGFSAKFKDGTIAPVIANQPIFVTDQDKAIVNITDVAGSGGASDEGSGDLTWVDTNLFPGVGACYVTSTGSGDKSNLLRLRFTIPASTLTGYKAQNLYARLTIQAGAAGFEVYRAWLQSIQTTAPARNPDSVTYLPITSEERGHATSVPNGTNYVYIGAAGLLDLWGLENFTEEDTDVYLYVQFVDRDVNTPTIAVEAATLYVESLPSKRKVWLTDKSASINYATGYITHYQVMDGDWSTDDATGYYTLEDVSISQWPIPGGIGIWSATGKGGTQYATLQSIERNLLPSYEQLQNASARAVAENTSIGSDGIEKVIVANGVSPAFICYGDQFSFIRTPVDPWRDRPRFCLPHRNHLILSIDDHILISSIGTFNNFSTFDGASAFKIGDQVTGLVAMPDNTVVIGCNSIISRLGGSSSSGQDSWQVSTINPKSGCLPYSMVKADDLYMLDTFGLKTLSTSDRFGDFDGSNLSSSIEPWLRPRLALQSKIVPDTVAFSGAGRIPPGGWPDITDDNAYTTPPNGFMQMIPVRSKNQLRAFFGDETILYTTLPSGEQAPPQFTMVNFGVNLAWTSGQIQGSTFDSAAVTGYELSTIGNYKATSCSSVLTGQGDEWVLVGTENGEVLRMDVGTKPPQEVAFTTNPISADLGGNTTLQQDSVTLLLEHKMGHEIGIVTGQDFRVPTLLTGALTDADGDHKGSDPLADTEIFTGEILVDRVTVYQKLLSDGLSWAVIAPGTTYGDYYGHNKFISLMPKIAPRDSNKGYGQRGLNYGSTKKSLNSEI